MRNPQNIKSVLIAAAFAVTATVAVWVLIVSTATPAPPPLPPLPSPTTSTTTSTTLAPEPEIYEPDAEQVLAFYEAVEATTTTAPPPPPPAPPATQPPAPPATVEAVEEPAALAEVSAHAGPSSLDAYWDRMAQCETGGNWQHFPYGTWTGGLGIYNQTWQGWGGGEFAPTAGQATREQQIIVANRIATEGYGNLGPVGYSAWGCLSAVGYP